MMSDMSNISELALFKVDNIICGIDITHIQEINKNLSFTKIYDAKNYIKGVLNLRGQIVTIIDLRVLFRREPSEDDDPNRRMIIVNHNEESVGFLVDEIDDIIHVETERLEDSVTQMKGVNPEFFSGVYKLDNGVVIILDVNALLSEEENNEVA